MISRGQPALWAKNPQSPRIFCQQRCKHIHIHIHVRLASIYKGKGCKRDPGNYRGVSIISIVIKIISKICAKRLSKHFVRTGGDDQHSKAGGGCADGTFTVKLAASLLREHGGEAYIAFIDLEKAYDTVNRDLLWKILAKYGVPEGLINVLKKLYANLTIHLKIDGDKRWHFYTSGVKQGGPEASVLFSFFMDAVVRTLELEWIAEGIDIPHFRWFTDNRGNQLPKGQLIGTDARNKGKRDIDVWKSLYVDDMAVIFTNRQDVDKGMKLSVKHFRRFGLSIHTGTLDAEGNLVKKSKTEILYIPPKHQRKMEYTSFVEQTVDVMIGGGRFMSFCDKFKYLGSWITYDLSDDFDVDCRINAGMTQFYAWRQGIFQNRDMPLEIRVKFYKAVVVNTLLWGCETWSMTSRHRRRLESCHHTCLRSILRISKIQRIRNSEIRERAGISTMRNMYELRRARYLHKIARMDAHWCGNQRYVRALLAAWKPSSEDPNVRGGHSNRERGRTCQTLRHGYRNTLRFFGFDNKDSIDLQKWMVEARDIKKWGPRVEETLGLDSGSFQSLYRAQNNFG